MQPGGTALSVEAGRKLENVYDNLMHMAEISSDSVEACRLYFDAVAIDESRQDAYHAFLCAGSRGWGVQ